MYFINGNKNSAFIWFFILWLLSLVIYFLSFEKNFVHLEYVLKIPF